MKMHQASGSLPEQLQRLSSVGAQRLDLGLTFERRISVGLLKLVC